MASSGSVGKDAPPYRFVVAAFHLGWSTGTVMAEHRTARRTTSRWRSVNTMLVRAHQTTFAPVFLGPHLLREPNWFRHAIASHVSNPVSRTPAQAPVSAVRTEGHTTLGGLHSAFVASSRALAPRKLKLVFPILPLALYNSKSRHGAQRKLIHSLYFSRRTIR